MIRWAKIEAKTEDAVQIRVLKKASCIECTEFCQKPLFDFFSQKKGAIWFHKSPLHYHITNPELIFSDARQVGQKVGIEWSDRSLLKSAFWVYMLPLLIILMTMYLGHMGFQKWSLPQDLGALTGLAFGLVLTLAVGRMIQRNGSLPKVTFL